MLNQNSSNTRTIYHQLHSALTGSLAPVLVTALLPTSGEVQQCLLRDGDDYPALLEGWAADGIRCPLGVDRDSYEAALTKADRTGLPVVLGDVYSKSDVSWVIERFKPDARLIIFGGGTIAEHLVHRGVELGFSVTICDDRPGFANTVRFPDAARVICDSFDRILQTIDIQPSDYVVIVTRGHQYDTECLRHVLPIQPVYFGMIGSRRRVAGTIALMKEEGFTDEQLSRLCSPIGFNIGAITPAEIALSILAQVVCCRRLQLTTPAPANVKAKRDDSDLDMDLMTWFTDPANESKPCALLSILAARGSSPRGPGARMLVFRNGKTLGSIGGGCAEGDAISIARSMVNDEEPSYKILRVDMTGDVAADEGMVCGGELDILIQPLLAP